MIGRQRHGVLAGLRRMSGAVLAVAFVVWAVGLGHAHALALGIGEESCVVMGGSLLHRTPATDPTDLADRSHDCCDLGLCLTGAALAPEPPADLPAPIGVGFLAKPPAPAAITLATPHSDHAPRGPPLA